MVIAELFSNINDPTTRAAFPAVPRGTRGGAGAGRRAAIGCLRVRWRRCCESRALGLVRRARARHASCPGTPGCGPEVGLHGAAGLGARLRGGGASSGSAPCRMGRRRRSRVRSTGRCGEDGADQGIVSAGGREASGVRAARPGTAGERREPPAPLTGGVVLYRTVPCRAARVRPGGAVSGADARWASLGFAAPEAPGPPQPRAASPRPLLCGGRGAVGAAVRSVRGAAAGSRSRSAAARGAAPFGAPRASGSARGHCAPGRASQRSALRAGVGVRAPLCELKRLRRVRPRSRLVFFCFSGKVLWLEMEVVPLA